jgi:hypothetical protein
MKKVTFKVLCPYNKEHNFPVVMEVGDESGDAKSTFEEYCPFCDKYVQVRIEGKLELDSKIYRLFGFKVSETY